MSYSLHVAKVYQMQYDSLGFFNHDIENINRLIFKYMPDAYFYDAIDYSARVEIPTDQFMQGIEKMKQETEPLIPNSRFTNSEIVKIFEHFYEKHDPENDYVYLEWF